MDLKADGTASAWQSLFRLNRRRLTQASLGSLGAMLFHQGAVGAKDGLDGSPLHTFPSNGWKAASHLTQISFRGEIPDSLGPIYATGPESGEHTGTVTHHSDGKGFSWVPDLAFHAGEEITVHTRLNIVGADEGEFSFSCATPRLGRARGARNEDPDDENVRRFRTRPGLVPPKLTAELHNGDPAPGLLFLTVIQGKGQNGALIVDNSGEPVWFLPATPNGHEFFDLKVIEYQGEPALLWWVGIRVLGKGSGHWVIANNAYEEIATVIVGNGYPGGVMHDARITSANTAIVGAYNTIEWDLSKIGGKQDGTVVDCVLQEIDIVTRCVMFEWHSLDHVALDESYRGIDPGEPDGPHDYFHYNSVAEDENGDLILSARNTWTTYKVGRASGDVLWRMGGTRSDFELAEGAEVAYQHDAQPAGDNTISFFDNAANPVVRDESRGVVIKLDTDQMTASVDREYQHPDSISAGSQGSMQVLPNGNVLIGWGSEPQLSEFAADGTLILDIHFPEEKQSYRAKRFEWIGQPADRPRVVTETTSDGAITLYASWNGATEVAGWRVQAGAAEDELSVSGEPTKRTGFETAIEIASNARFFAVEAIDVQGISLGTSTTVDAWEPAP